MDHQNTPSRADQLLLDRRRFLAHTATGLGASALTCSTGAGSLPAAENKPRRRTGNPENSEKAPFNLLYNNDCTNIAGCVSPFHARGEKLHARMIEASVDEIAGTGVDASLLSPGMGWVPWWPSKVYPDHHQWFLETHRDKVQMLNETLKRCADFVAGGGDVVKPFVDRCRHHNIAPFITYRLNDAHFQGKSTLDSEKPRFWWEHPEYRFSPGSVQNWAIPEVRQYKLDLITELLENYDLAGIELDFLRHWWYFNQKETSSVQRKTIMAEFVSRVRKVLDRTVRPGQRRWLCVRVPIALSKHDAIGIDLPRWVGQCGVEMVNLSASYFAHQEGDLPKIRRMTPGAAIYHESCHCTQTAWLPRPDRTKIDHYYSRLTTDDEFYTAAHLAYQQGADGISLFNFVYYREHPPLDRYTFREPPFPVLEHLRDKQWLARRRQQYYFLGSHMKNWNDVAGFQLPRTLSAGNMEKLTMRMGPPEDLGGLNLYLRVHTKEPSAHLDWSVRLSGKELVREDFRGEPIEQPYDGLLGKPDQRTGWTGKPNTVREGDNQVEITLNSGGPVDVVRIDLALTPRRWSPKDRRWYDM